MKIALASPPFPESLQDGMHWLKKLAKDAAQQGAEIVCFPESYLPGYPGMGYSPEDRAPESLRSALNAACSIAAENAITIIVPMDWHTPQGLLNVAHVISATGQILGYQAKNQLDPSEDALWIPGTERRIFEVNGIKFGITICHEGFRYPESVRWAAQQGAHIVFHPYFTGSNTQGITLSEWGHTNSPYYEKAQMLRAMENTIYFAGSNYASLYPEAASAVIGPDGTCLAHAIYGRPGITVANIDTALATGLLARRFKGSLYRQG
jgi:predicted amidohydrolase